MRGRKGIATSRETDAESPLHRQDHGRRVVAFGATPDGPVPRERVEAELNARGYDRSGRRWYDEGRLAASLGVAKSDPAFTATWTRSSAGWTPGRPASASADGIRGTAVSGPSGTRRLMDPACYAAFEALMRGRDDALPPEDPGRP